MSGALTTREARLVREMVTPEGVGLHLRLAEAGVRIGAFLLDVLFIALALLALTLASLLVLAGTGIDLAAIIWLLGFFVLRNFYFALFELRPRAATPGKRLLGIRVASRNGGRLTADMVLARNLVRELELFLPLTLLAAEGSDWDWWLVLLGIGWTWIFLFFPLLNRDRLRVGDLLAGTWVVRAPTRRLLQDLAAAPDTAALSFTQAQLAVYGVKELHVLEDVLRSPDPATMAAVAGRIAGRIGWQRARETDLDFLAAYYAALRGRLERGLLFGRRQKDKFDRA